MSTFSQRISRAAESILENEGLTSNLDDTAADSLISWGVACARMAARATSGLNDAEAEDVMSPRLRATRRLMRRINRWIPKRLYKDAESNAASLTKIVDQATVIYGSNLTTLGSEWQDVFLNRNLDASPTQLIVNLRASIEDQHRSLIANSGGNQ